MTVPRVRIQLLLLFLLLTTVVASAQRGALVQPRNLVQLVDQSSVIIRGYVVSATVQPHPELKNLSTVSVRVRVDRALKGSASGEYAFRQFIWDVRDIDNAAGYRKGQEVLLLLNPPTRYGLQSTAGLDQGRFNIQRDSSGNALISNARLSSSLFQGVQEIGAKRGIKFSSRASNALVVKDGGVSLDAFEDMISALTGGGR